MSFILPIFFISITIITTCKSQSPEWQFPSNFKFGVATSAYQIEGGWDADGKGVSVWDIYTPDITNDHSDGKIACDSYHKWQEDVQMVKNLSVHYYRFSLAWTRLFPDGFTTKLNQPGVDYYNNLINGLLENGIEPVITLYHWDQPQNFSPLGGFTSPNIIQLFADYARAVFGLFGDRVKIWITFNEPKVMCQDFHEFRRISTSPYPSGVIEYMCTHNLLLAHAEAYHIYDKEFRAKQNGKVGITLNFEWSEPDSDSPEDIAAAEQRRQFEFGLYAHPIIRFDYPQIVIDRVDAFSKAENYPQSRLAKFTHAEKLKIRGTYDYIGLNHYSTWMVKYKPDNLEAQPSYSKDVGTERYQPDEWQGSGAEWNKVVPWGLRRILNWIKQTYNNPEVLITECGYPDKTGEIEDSARTNFYKLYLNATLEAILLDGAKVTSFMAWSLMDNFEWHQGYQIKFGLYQVDFDDVNRKRTPKESVKYFKSVAETRRIE